MRVFYPTLDGKAPFQVLLRSLFQENAGEITSGCLLPSAPDKVFFGHTDGKVSVYSTKDYNCVELLNVSTFKINSLSGSCGNIWAGHSNGKVCVYDATQSPWVIKKEWQAHDNPVIKLIADRSAFYKLDRAQLISLGADSMLRAWDGLLTDDRFGVERDTQSGHREHVDVVGTVADGNRLLHRHAHLVGEGAQCARLARPVHHLTDHPAGEMTVAGVVEEP